MRPLYTGDTIISLLKISTNQLNVVNLGVTILKGNEDNIFVLPRDRVLEKN